MILIVDINHGGLDVAIEYKHDFPDEKIYLWDIYGKLRDKNFVEKNIFKIKSVDEIIPYSKKPNFSDYNEIIAPIHCPINVEFKSFHQFVSEIIKKRYGNLYKKFITITGVKGKTTTSEMVYSILNEDYNVFLNNSNRGSITPISVLNSINNLNDLEMLGDYDYFIFEVSLGLVSSKYGIITNIIENYPVGRYLRDAKFCKLSTVGNCDNVYSNKDLEKDTDLYNLDNVKFVGGNFNILSKYPIEYEYDNKTIKLNDSLFGLHNIENSIFAYEVCKNIMEEDIIIERLGSIYIPNRMSIEKIPINRSISNISDTIYNNKNINNFIKNNIKWNKEIYIIKNINPGLNLKSIEYSIRDFLSVFPNNCQIVVGGDEGCTCEDIDVKKLSEIIKKYSNDDINYLLVSDIGLKLKEYLNYPIYANLDDKNIKLTKNTLIIYRKKIN